MVVVYLDFAEGTAVPWTCSANTYVRHEAVAFPVRHDGMVGTVNDTRIPELVSEYVDVSSDILGSSPSMPTPATAPTPQRGEATRREAAPRAGSGRSGASEGSGRSAASHLSVVRFCQNCGLKDIGRRVFCSACGTSACGNCLRIKDDELVCEDCDVASSHASEPEAFVEPPDSPERRGAATTSRFGPLEDLDLAAVTTTFAEIGNRKIPGSYPETFGANPGEHLEDWKRAVQSWILSEDGQLPVEAIGVRMLAKLKDNAALVCRRYCSRHGPHIHDVGSEPTHH